MTTTLRPLLRVSSTPAPSSLLFNLNKPLTQTRNANLIPRPKRPYLLDQMVILSDGSAYKQLTTSPRGVIRSTKDARNHPMWNPSMRELADVEEDEAGKLRRFRQRFGTGFEDSGEEGVGGLADMFNLMNEGEGEKGEKK